MTSNGDMELTVQDPEYSALLHSYKEVLRSTHGKRVLLHILSLCELYSASDTGRRLVGLDILETLDNVHPTTYPQLLLDSKLGERHG